MPQRKKRGASESEASNTVTRVKPTASYRRRKALQEDVQHEAPPPPVDTREDEEVYRSDDESQENVTEADENYGGGPSDKSVLYHYKHHVAKDIWEGEERGCLKLIVHNLKLEQWDLSKECNSFKEMLSSTGLMGFAGLAYKNINKVVVSAFVERWHPETNSFHLPFGEMTITLHDVQQILGAPIVGIPVGGKYVETLDDIKGKFVKGLGCTSEEFKDEINGTRGRGNGVRLEWLRSNWAGKVTDQSSPIDIRRAVRAFLLYLFGCTLFADKTCHQISVFYMSILFKFENIKEFAWGPAILAYLYRQLGNSSRSQVKTIAGFLTLLEAWVYEHFPMLQPIPNTEYQHNLPRVKRWGATSVTYAKPDEALSLIREKLDLLTEKDVLWDPYHNIRPAIHDIVFFHGLITCLDVTEAYHADRVYRQFGYVQRIPSEALKPYDCNRPSSGVKYKVRFVIPDQYWENYKCHIIPVENRGRRVNAPWECEPNYLEWYKRISHPRIQNDERSSGLHIHPPWKLDMIVDKVSELLDKAVKLHDESREADYWTHILEARQIMVAQYVPDDES